MKITKQILFEKLRKNNAFWSYKNADDIEDDLLIGIRPSKYTLLSRFKSIMRGPGFVGANLRVCWPDNPG